jgi:leader peptidase (prepilin peptidase)/N-methyltransferase
MNVRLMDSLLGVLAGGGCLYLIAVAYRLLKKREGMGGGDIKLLAMIGGFLGLQSLIFVLLASSLLGAVIGILIIILKKGGMKYAIPFGPFLSTAAIAYIFFGEFTARFLLIM